MELLLQDFPVVTEINVAWGEMDALQHINNVVYFRYFETARIEYFNKINLMDEIKRNQIGPVLSETQCRYRIPVTFPDTLLIGSRVSEVGEDRFTMEYQVVSKKMGKVTTTGSATVVMFDFKNQSKAQLPAALRDAIFSIEAKKA
ncbi:acyl-CoA thioesterase [Vibrio vulnificus]|uniref:acyl-CoA thioesterase n=1 Tax=Vibrio vulnificus TaxID=672 RepID=UPI001A2897CE|nr:acyl-CoA thioesterase [Vibrio vulnificus]EGQ7835720.1 acyl-CoA thioesterase [Vibrio vulnificus]EHI9271449.1 acyl-CoA thioesterase [Vibrio vulnificus]EHI9275256.1 acyl-CoA thioesterase [Vibrio vulnificus]EHK8973987.1 acyl-CoA thioesterase [Vibrio vulnificus]